MPIWLSACNLRAVSGPLVREESTFLVFGARRTQSRTHGEPNRLVCGPAQEGIRTPCEGVSKWTSSMEDVEPFLRLEAMPWYAQASEEKIPVNSLGELMTVAAKCAAARN